MKNLVILSVFVIFIISTFNLNSEIKRGLPITVDPINCNNGRQGWIVSEDLDKNGIYYHFTKLDCDGKIYQFIIGFDDWLPWHNNIILPHNNTLTNPKIQLNDLSTATSTQAEVVCFDSISNLNFYKVTFIDTLITVDIYYNNIPAPTSLKNSNLDVNLQNVNSALRDEVRLSKNSYFKNEPKDESKPNIFRVGVYDDITKKLKYTIEFTDNPITKKTYCVPRSVNKSIIENSDILGVGNIYPNPTKDILNININSKENINVNFRIIDIKSNTISKISQSLTAGDNNLKLDLDKSLPNGTYFLQMEINGNIINRPFVISK